MHAAARSLTAAMLCLAACGGPEASRLEEQSGQGNDALINGQVAAANELRGTLNVVGRCTATKVGEHHILIASHCVRQGDGTVVPELAPGHTFQLERRTSAGPVTGAFTVAQTTLHPAIIAWCKSVGCFGGTAASSQRDAPDVAVITTVEELLDVPTAPVDQEPVLPGDATLLLGYGCRTSTQFFDADGLLRAAPAPALPPEAIIHPGSPYTAAKPDAVALMASDYVFTPGPGGTLGAPGLCPGDSGGALYRMFGATAYVVGVNASYTFPSPNAGLPVTNWHARVDVQANHDVTAWLQSLGVVTARSCDHDAGTCPQSAGFDAGSPTSVDAGFPMSVDAGVPTSVDAGVPTSVDAGVPTSFDAGH